MSDQYQHKRRAIANLHAIVVPIALFSKYCVF